MGRWVGLWVSSWILAAACADTIDGSVRPAASVHDGGGAATSGGARPSSGGSSATGGGGSGTATGGSPSPPSSGGSGPRDASADGLATMPDARSNLADGGCVPTSRSQAPDSSQYCTAEICRSGSGWEIVITDPRGFQLGHQVWVLLIGDQHFIESRYPSGGNGQIGFAVTEAQYAGLERGEPLLAYYRSPPLTDAAIVAPPGGRYCGDF